MTQHYSEADLLETYYTQPGESMPVMMHLADCHECAARYEKLEGKLRALDACHQEKPESFWARQRIAVMRRIDTRRARTSVAARTSRVAAAAALVLVLGGVWALQDMDRKPQPQTAPPTQTARIETADASSEAPSATTDPWQSEELSDFQPVVAWESWVEAEKGKSL